MSVRRSTKGASRPAGATGADRRQPERPSIVHSSLYLPEPVYEALRKIAFEERLKIHDIVLEGIDAALRRRGYPSIESLRAGAVALTARASWSDARNCWIWRCGTFAIDIKAGLPLGSFEQWVRHPLRSKSLVSRRMAGFVLTRQAPPGAFDLCTSEDRSRGP